MPQRPSNYTEDNKQKLSIPMNVQNRFGKRNKMSERQKRARRSRRQILACLSKKETKTMTKKQKKMRNSYRKMKSYMKNC